MNVNERESKALEVAIGAAYEVANQLGGGFLEKVYERSLEYECRLRGLEVRAQVRCPVRYKGRLVGDYAADLVVDGLVVVELKCVDAIAREHVTQCLNYLKASGLRVALSRRLCGSRQTSACEFSEVEGGVAAGGVGFGAGLVGAALRFPRSRFIDCGCRGRSNGSKMVPWTSLSKTFQNRFTG